MEPKYSIHPHRPPHIFIEEHDYFLTGRIWEKKKLLMGARREILLAAINKNLLK
jgi:hypothetical protein